MVYRIRYCDAREQRQHEVLVEANNTTEAMVKFCHARGPAPGAGTGLAGARVSISREPDELPPAETDVAVSR